MRRKTHKEFLEQIEKINNNIEILSQYEKDNIKIKCKCKICGNEWMATPSNLLRGKGCKQCHFKKLKELKIKSHEDFIEDVKNKNANIKILSKYNGIKNRVDCKCLIHNTNFNMYPNHILRGATGCKECIKIKNHLSGLKSHEQFIKEANYINDKIKIIGKYNGAKERVEVKCLKCGVVWNPVASSILSGCGCPHCKKSRGERKIERYLIDCNIDFEKQKKFPDLRNTLPLSYDFYLPKYNLLIEYQGQFHDGTAYLVDKDLYFEKQKINDNLKREYAIKNNYNLLEIWYYDFKNIENIINKHIYNLKNPVTTTVA